MMVPIPVLVLGAAVIVVLLFLLLRRGQGPRDLSAPPPRLRPRIAVPSASLPPGLEEQARALIAEGQHIEAIKRVREATGLGLMEAKNLVDAIERGEPL